MAHFDKLIKIFNAMEGGIEVTDLALDNCSIHGSLFFFLINKNTHSLTLKNVRVFEGNLVSTTARQPTPKAPAFWEDIIPVFIHQARLTHCHLEGLQDYTSSLSDERSGALAVHAEGRREVKQGLRQLYWDLCWCTWCSDPVEHSFAEVNYELRLRPDPRHQTAGPLSRQQ